MDQECSQDLLRSFSGNPRIDMICAARDGDIEALNQLRLLYGRSDESTYATCLKEAIVHNHLNIVQLLYPHVNHGRWEWSIEIAALTQRKDILIYLLSLNERTISWLTMCKIVSIKCYEQEEIIHLLLPRTSTWTYLCSVNKVIENAAFAGWTSVVKVLLPQMQTTKKKTLNTAFAFAARCSYLELISLLFPLVSLQKRNQVLAKAIKTGRTEVVMHLVNLWPQNDLEHLTHAKSTKPYINLVVAFGARRILWNKFLLKLKRQYYDDALTSLIFAYQVPLK